MTSVAIVAPGGMGSALAKRIAEHGAEVLTSLAGRGEETRQRAVAAGMRDVGDAGLAQADIVLSVVPPDQALPLAERLGAALGGAGRKPLYVDCNAVGPQLASEIEAVVSGAGLAFADAGIIGLPPKPGTKGPTIFVSGPHAERAAAMMEPLGIRMQALARPNGAASALKMAYAGVTKGLIAIAATMAVAAERAGVGEEFAAELANSQANLHQSFTRSVPDMLPKARRWIPEMTEIEGFVGEAARSGAAYAAFAEFYRQVADDPDLQERLGRFYKSAEA